MLTTSTSYPKDVDVVNTLCETNFVRRRNKPRYHHGNLRSALIECGLELIDEKGIRALTLREIGSRLGVSRSAAYRHFKDKAALLSAMLAGLLRAYVHHCHRRNGFVGHRWQGRFQSPAVEEGAYLLSCGRSIERNPVEAGLVSEPWQYPWSSLAQRLGSRR